MLEKLFLCQGEAWSRAGLKSVPLCFSALMLPFAKLLQQSWSDSIEENFSILHTTAVQSPTASSFFPEMQLLSALLQLIF